VRSRLSIRKAPLLIGTALVLFVALVLVFSVKRYRTPEAAPPEALAHIAEKNRDAAAVAAAHQRIEAAASTNAAQAISAAQVRGEASANAMLARFPNDDNRTEAAGRQN
jgi:hypothetical protein